jgi:hypothetical protein
MENYEEKYKNLINQLKKAKEEHGGYTFSSVVNKIVPELCESEDEKIRKSLIKSFENQHSCNFPTVDGFTREQIISWLEKQDEQKSTDSYCQKNCKGFQETGKCFADGECKAKIEAEQKSTWSEDDERIQDNCIEYVKASCLDRDESNECINWLKSIKPNHWKPSKEHLSSLGRFIEGVYGCVDFTNIKSLYNELKQL